MLAVERDGIVHYFQGQRLGDLIRNIRPGERFYHTRYERTVEHVSEMKADGTYGIKVRKRVQCASRSSTTPTSPSTA